MLTAQDFNRIRENILEGFSWLIPTALLLIFIVIVDVPKLLVFIPIVTGVLGAMLLYNGTFSALRHLGEYIEP